MNLSFWTSMAYWPTDVKLDFVFCFFTYDIDEKCRLLLVFLSNAYSRGSTYIWLHHYNWLLLRIHSIILKGNVIHTKNNLIHRSECTKSNCKLILIFNFYMKIRKYQIKWTMGIQKNILLVAKLSIDNKIVISCHIPLIWKSQDLTEHWVSVPSKKHSENIFFVNNYCSENISSVRVQWY